MPKQLDTSQASANRLSGKQASDAFKGGNNAGMLFKKDAKGATNIQEYRDSLQKLRMKEAASKDDSLRGWTGGRK